jgi:hypothetical protein
MTRVLLAFVAIAVALAACSEDGESSVRDESETPLEIAMAVRAEVLDALGLDDDRVELLGSGTEKCVDSLGSETGEELAQVDSRAAPGVLSPERFEQVGERLGASDVRASDITDPFEPDKVIGREITVFADRGGRNVIVSMQLTDEGFDQSVLTDCPR